MATVDTTSIKVSISSYDAFCSLYEDMGRKYKKMEFLEVLVNSYRETHCPEDFSPLDTLPCKKCGGGGSV